MTRASGAPGGHYSLERIRASLLHFLVGKAFAAVATIVVMLLVARALEKSEYAAYILFVALVQAAGLFSSFGVGQSLVRYVPELRASHNNLAMYRLLFRGVLSRSALFAVAMMLLALGAGWLAQGLQFQAFAALLPGYAWVGWLRLSGQFLAQGMESLLWQKASQYSLAIGGMVRLALVALAYASEDLSLARLIGIEMVAEAAVLALLLFLAWRNWRKDAQRGQGDAGWLRANRQRVLRYGYTGYLQALSKALHGFAANRLVAGWALSPAAFAGYGFAESMASILLRVLPSQLLQGMLRPVYIARYTQTRDIGQLERLANLAFRVNLVLMSAAILLILLSGQELLTWLTAAKYGDTAYLLAALIGVLTLESLRVQQELVCITLERNALLIGSNLILSASIVLALPLFAYLGAWSIVVANLAGNLMAIGYTRRRLGGLGYRLRFDDVLVWKAMRSAALALGLGQLLSLATLPAMVAGPLALVAYFFLLGVFSPFSQEEMRQMKGLMGPRMKTR